MDNNSYFDGKLHQMIGWSLLSIIITIFTLGIGYPWAVVMKLKWINKHTVVNGRRLQFNGTALGLFGSYIKWFLLSIITLGIYAFWLNIKLYQWKAKNTDFAD
ncbi:DUF898 family protein [Fructilactobacillus carniphilus]|uniref:YjgN family protein n=1 Tax=Fructilactobacillus carniphilus TaxID=2940297 RepID=A0ABY5BY14_9LACO|nr:DUF898 family protein [Fructilactobacillus carniphilus]USS90818.1 YjgN family protein [Fructilactobacillus carniphilus]